ncbi:MAG: hypothetical protein IPG86_16205 [Chitinophagaceae bacterium]|nr:hypothetical protein [Chitinophagaceae bacterium]
MKLLWMRLVKKTDRDKVASIIYVADCQSPNGAYTTELQSDTTGYTYFKQVYSFRKDSFIQVIHNRGRDTAQQHQPVSPETVYALRSHEFMSIVLELNKRFTNFKFADTLPAGKGRGFQLLAKDELGHESWLTIDSATSLIKEIRFPNPDNNSEIISTAFSSWKKVNEFNFPHHIEFTQAGRTYTFDIRTLKMNDPGFKQID